MAQHDCPICQCDIGHQAFVAPGAGAEDVDLDMMAFRLKCGHGFHTACLCRALRGSSGCPVCRSGAASGSAAGATGAAADTVGLNLVIDADGNMHLELPEDSDDTASVGLPVIRNLARTATLVAALERVSRSPDVQNHRTRLNRELREYRSLEAFIMQRRRSLMRDALSRLRSECLRDFDARRRSLQRALAAVRRASTAVLERDPDGTSLVSDIHEMMPNEFTLAGTVGNDDVFGPLKHRFWHH